MRFNEEWGILKQRGEDLNMKATLSGIQKEINQIRSVNIRSCMWLKVGQEVTIMHIAQQKISNCFPNITDQW